MKKESDPGEKAIRFIEKLHLTGPHRGKRFVLREWQKKIIRAIFGNIDPVTKRRRIRKVFALMGRKQGKSQIIAAVAMYCLVGSGKQGEAIYIGASKREQAAHLWGMIADMIAQSPSLKKLLTVIPHKKRIEYKDKGSIIQALSSDGASDEGSIPTVVIIDELFAHKNRRLWDSLTSGFGATPEPLQITITTAGNDRNGLCWEEYQYACKVRDGEIIDPTCLPIIHEVKEDEDWTDEKNWYKAMPALGDFCSLENIKDEFRKAQHVLSEERKFRQKYLGQWVSKYITSWLPISHWNQCAQVNLDKVKDEQWYCGLDLAAVSDFASFVMYSPTSHSVLPFIWLPEESADRNPHFRIWADKGFITLTEGNITDFDVIRPKIVELSKEYNIEKIAVDDWNSTQITTQLSGEGLELVKFRQGFKSMNPPAKQLERLILSHRLRHTRNPAMTWQASNVVCQVDPAGNIKLDKSKSSEKIDSLVALCMAIGICLEPEEPSIYETRPIIFSD